MNAPPTPIGSVPRGLAVVRCGDRSLHQSWAMTTTLFDVAVSYFGSDEGREFPEARFVHRYRGGKWDGIAAFFDENSELLGRYDYFWFPDDDLSFTGLEADKLLEIGTARRLDLWQPSLDHKSYHSHLITIKLDGLLLRYTNFIEIMAPVLKRHLVEDSLPLFRKTKSGFGLDYLWPQRAGDFNIDGHYACAVVDAVAVTHTRPIGSALKVTISSGGGLSQREEYALILEHVRSRHPLFRSMMLSVPRRRMFSGYDLQGRRLGRWQLWRTTFRQFRRNIPARTQSIAIWDLIWYLATTFH